jgi:hypothetical protein
MKRGLRFLAWIALGLIAVFVFGLTTMLLWNWLIPTLFSGPVITFWQALGLMILSKILFWGFGGGKRGCGCHKHGAGGSWKGKFYEKFASMTPAEKEALKQKMKEKWCYWDENVSAKDSGASND